MREQIILAAIKLLDNLSVKFTIDDIKNQLKISKKTIYKYFSSKEELASAVFNYIIDRAKAEQLKILSGASDNKVILYLLQYMEIYRLQSDKIFNLFSLNAKLLADIKQSAQDNWQEVLKTYNGEQDAGKINVINNAIFKIIVEGIFQNIYHLSDRAQIGYECIAAIINK